jgi:DDE superfamily endonuclease
MWPMHRTQLSLFDQYTRSFSTSAQLICTMPYQTERQQAADALQRAFLVNLMAEHEEELLDFDDDSDPESSSSSSDSSSDDEHIPSISDMLLESLGELYSKRYLKERDKIDKSEDHLQLLLTNWKVNWPEIFRSYLRITPQGFDDLVATLQDDPIFHNNSNNQQTPVDQQVAIALYRFGHYGNAASQMKVALWAGVGYGTVSLFTSRVMAATCSDRFRHSALHWASEEAKEAAKSWVENASCPAWRNGWLMVDGTLIPLFMRPAFFGNTWFDRKSNYSLNVQVSLIICLMYYISNCGMHQLVSTPDLHIIDYGVGLPGSQHDATAWAETRVPQEHQRLLSDDEWVWADSAYPLQKWCQSPYKKYVSNCVCRLVLILINLTDLRRTLQRTQSTTIMCPRFEFTQSIVLDS